MPFGIFATGLDAYPTYEIDESAYFEPALRALAGQGFNYRVSADQPYADLVFGGHGPFWPRLQQWTFSLFGLSSFAGRIVALAGGYLAIGVLAAFLLRRSLWLTAVLVTLAWVASPMARHMVIGRMEGPALLALTLGAIALVRTLEAPSAWRAFGAGLALGTACGFHPLCVSFASLGSLLLLGIKPRDGVVRLSWPDRSRLRLLACYALGGLMPAALVVWSWWPYVREALIQFRWSSQVQTSETFAMRVGRMLRILGRSRTWAGVLLGLVPVVTLAGWPTQRADGQPRLNPRTQTLWVVAVTFTLAGLLTLLRSNMRPYYLSYGSTWPVLALGLLIEGLPAERRGLRRPLLGVVFVLMLSLIPSGRRNAQELGESIEYRSVLNQQALARRLATIVPAGVPVTGSPQLSLIARRAGLDYTSLVWTRTESQSVPPEHWLLLLKRPDEDDTTRVEPQSLAGRPVVFEGPAFPRGGKFSYPIVILGPVAPPPDRRDH